MEVSEGVRIPPPPVFVRCLSENEDCRGVAVITAKPGIVLIGNIANYDSAGQFQDRIVEAILIWNVLF